MNSQALPEPAPQSERALSLFDEVMERFESAWARHRRRVQGLPLGRASALKPGSGVERRGRGFEALDADPQLHPRRRRYAPGYYLLYVHVVPPSEGAYATLYVDDGEGFREGLSFGLRVHPARPVFRIVRLERAARALRFDPIEEPGPFEVRAFAFVRVPAAFARRRMETRLALLHEKTRGKSAPLVRAFVTSEARARGRSYDEALVPLYGGTFLRRVRRGDYSAWRALVEAPAEAELDENRAAILGALPARPRISVLVPTYDTDPEHLEACIESVRAQSYPGWELCIADDASKKRHVRAMLEDFARRDPRVKLVFREDNGHICRASNDALALATGDYVAFLDHDDALTPNALLHVVRALAESPSAALVYGDEDKLGEDGVRRDPHFKPRWNPELLLAQNYIGHLVVARTEHVRALGGLRPGFEGSQDHDLLLRLTERLCPEQIVHVPHILYHWRASATSTARDAGAKSYTAEAGRRAVADALARRGEAGTVEHAPAVPNGYRVRFSLPDEAPLVSLIVPTRDAVDLLSVSVGSILSKTTYPNFEILVVDNESAKAETIAYFKRIGKDRRVRVLDYHAPFNFSEINNFAVREAHGTVVGLVNNDIEVVNGDWLTEMLGHALQPEAGCVGAKLLYPNDTVQHAGVIIGLGGVAGHSHKHFPKDQPGYFHRLKLTHAVSAVTAACLVVRKSVYEEVGGLDTSLAVAFNDVDFCLRVGEAGYRNIFTPYAVLYHHESATRGHETTPEKATRFNGEIARMKSRWGDALLRDPYYSPHLTLEHEDFSIGFRT